MINVINAIEEKLQAQKDDIFIKQIQIDDLKKKLAAAEKELAEAKETIDGQTAAIESIIKKAEADNATAANGANV
jgi:FtsZ-binding cell division protein ZapB